MNQEITHLSMGELTDYLERRLPPADTYRVETHLASGCPACREELDWLSDTLSLMASDDWVEPPDEIVATVQAAARRANRQKSPAKSTQPNQITAPMNSLSERLRALFMPPRLVWGAVAVVTVLVLLVVYTRTFVSVPDSHSALALATQQTAPLVQATKIAEGVQSTTAQVPSAAQAVVVPTVQAIRLTQTVAFIDDFSSPNSGLPPQVSEGGASSGYENGMYVMTANFSPSNSNWERYQELDFHDLTLNVDAQRLHGSESDFYGIVFRVVDNDNYYLFQVSDNGFAELVRFTDRRRESLTDKQRVKTYNDQPNQLTVEARGSRITVSVNSEEFHTLDDARIAHGTIGFLITNTSEPLTVGFDNLVVDP
jgi:hypothetical protein